MTSLRLTPPKPLYLPASAQLQVAVDGPALRVKASHRAAQWLPLDRISRVLSAIDVQWETPALIACLRAGVPVIFIDGYGNAQGFCYGPRHRENSLTSLLVELIERPDWDDHYQAWLEAVQHQLVRRQLLRCGLRATRYREPRAARSALCNVHYRRLGVSVVRLLRHIQGAVHGMVVQHLHAAIPDQRFLGYPRPGFSLINDFASLMQWPAHRLLSQVELDDLVEPEGLPRLAAHLAEHNREQLMATLDELVTRFEYWLRDWEQEIVL